jgi:hypothetical protein
MCAPESIERSAMVDKKPIRFVLNLPLVSKDAVFLVDCELCRVICKVQKRLQNSKRMQAPVYSCRKRTSSSSFLKFSFHSRHLLSLQSCNRRQSHVDAKRQMEIMVGNQLSCLHFYSILLDEEHDD